MSPMLRKPGARRRDARGYISGCCGRVRARRDALRCALSSPPLSATPRCARAASAAACARTNVVAGVAVDDRRREDAVCGERAQRIRQRRVVVERDQLARRCALLALLVAHRGVPVQRPAGERAPDLAHVVLRHRRQRRRRHRGKSGSSGGAPTGQWRSGARRRKAWDAARAMLSWRAQNRGHVQQLSFEPPPCSSSRLLRRLVDLCHACT
jgi:hypothetical protein